MAMPWNPNYFAYLFRVMQGAQGEDEFRGIKRYVDDWSQGFLNDYFNGRFKTTPLAEEYYRQMLETYSQHPPTNQFIKLALAFRRPMTNFVHGTVHQRRAWGGNVVFEWTGPTGMGKSSCMLGLMEEHNGLRDVVLQDGTEGLRRHLAIDVQSLPSKLEALKPGQAVALDEQLHLVGEGANNAMDTLANLEETLRGTQIDIHFASPSLRQHTTSQGILEAFAWDPDAKETAFLVKIALMGNPEPQPLGVAILPWCSKETYEAYVPIKRENLERTKRLQFNASNETLDEEIRRFFENPVVQTRFQIKQPSKNDLVRWLRRYAPSTGSASSASMAEEILEMRLILRMARDRFHTVYGWDPSPAMLAAMLPPAATANAGQGGHKSDNTKTF